MLPEFVLLITYLKTPNRVLRIRKYRYPLRRPFFSQIKMSVNETSTFKMKGATLGPLLFIAKSDLHETKRDLQVAWASFSSDRRIFSPLSTPKKKNRSHLCHLEGKRIEQNIELEVPWVGTFEY